MSHKLAFGCLACGLFAGPILAAPPVDFDFGALSTSGFYHTRDGSITAAQIKWYRFVTPGCNAADNTYLDIDTGANPASGTALVDTEIGLYNAAGNLIGTNDDSGSATRSELSFGVGGRPAFGTIGAFNGQHGAVVPAGEYFVAVADFPTTFNATGFNVTGGNNSGSYRLEMRSGRMASATPPIIDADLGNIRGVNGLKASTALGTVGTTVRWVKFHIDFPTSAAGFYCDIHTIGSNLPGSNSNHDTVIALFDAAGAPVVGGTNDDYPNGGDFLSGLSFGRTANPRTYTGSGETLTSFGGQSGAVLAAGDYYIGLCRYAFISPAAGFVFGSYGSEPGGTLIVTVATSMPPAVDYDMGTIRAFNSPQRTPDLSLAAGQVRWITFRTDAATSAASIYCDIHTLGSALFVGPDQGDDTVIGVYAEDGVFVNGNDDFDGTFFSALSYGDTAPPRSYTLGSTTLDPFNGFTAAVLPAGRYFVAVVGFSGVSFLSNFRATSSSPYTGTVRLNVATNMGAGIDHNLGLINSANSPAATPQFAIAALGVKWVHFRTDFATDAANYYLDMHTLGSILTPTPNDTMIGLYNHSGHLVAANDDIQAFGESALSFGRVAPPRGYASPIGPLDGDNGAVLPPDDYFVAITAFAASFNEGFGVSSVSTRVGVVQLTLFSNLPGGRCNAADVAGLGGSIGPDGVITADDVIVFLAAFFASNLSVADIAGLGGSSGPDGALTPDDIIFFLARLFAPCDP